MEFSYPRDHARAFYNRHGQAFWCHSKDDEARAKEAGFTSAKYIPSYWPRTVFHKKTGVSKPVGNLDWSEEKNQAALAALGDDWTAEYVPVPEPVAAAPASAPMDLLGLGAILTELALMKKRVEELEEASIESDARVVELEAALTAKPVAAEVPVATPKVATAGAPAPAAKAKSVTKETVLP